MRENRLDHLTFTRFLAAIPIVVFHFGLTAFPASLYDVARLFSKANVGVSYFFVLSGFIMVLAHSQDMRIEPLRFFRRRVARIAPAYYLALAILTCAAFTASPVVDVSGLILNLTVLQAWIPALALSGNGPAWSLSVEVLFYAIFPFLFNGLYRRVGLAALAAGCVLLFVASQIVHHVLLHSAYYQASPSAAHNFVFHFPLMHLNEFVMGNVAALVYENYLAEKRRRNGVLICAIGLLIAILVLLPPVVSFHNGLMSILFVPLLLLFATDSGWFSRSFGRKPFVFLGEISYGVYILQLPVQMVVYSALVRAGMINTGALFLIFLPTLLLAACLSFHFVEMPLRRRINASNRDRNTILTLAIARPCPGLQAPVGFHEALAVPPHPLTRATRPIK